MPEDGLLPGGEECNGLCCGCCEGGAPGIGCQGELDEPALRTSSDHGSGRCVVSSTRLGGGNHVDEVTLNCLHS